MPDEPTEQAPSYSGGDLAQVADLVGPSPAPLSRAGCVWMILVFVLALALVGAGLADALTDDDEERLTFATVQGLALEKKEELDRPSKEAPTPKEARAPEEEPAPEAAPTPEEAPTPEATLDGTYAYAATFDTSTGCSADRAGTTASTFAGEVRVTGATVEVIAEGQPLGTTTVAPDGSFALTGPYISMNGQVQAGTVAGSGVEHAFTDCTFAFSGARAG